MTRIFATLAALAIACTLHAQDERPYAYLSTSDKEVEKDKTPAEKDAKAGSLQLRPNSELPYYVYIRNLDKAAWDNLTAVLAADEAGQRVLAEGTVARLESGQRVRVRLTTKALPPVVEKAASEKDKPAAPVAMATTALPETVYLFLVRPTEANPRTLLGKVAALPVLVMSPKQYLKVVPATPTGAKAQRNDFIVQIGENAEKPIRGKPVKVALNIRPDLLDGLDTSAPRQGTYEAVVASGAKDIILTAQSLKFLGSKRAGLVSITADGVANAFVFAVNFEGTTPTPLDKGMLHIDLPPFAVPGKPLTAKLETFGDPEAGKPKFQFFRSLTGEAEVITFPTPRDTNLSFRLDGEGDLLAGATVKDWQVPLETAGVVGTRKFNFDLEAAGKKFETAVAAVTFDETPPAGVAFVKAPLKVEKGTKFTVVAKAVEPESGLKKDVVLFFLGDPPVEGKKPVKGTFAVGVDKLDGTFAAEFDVPEGKGPFDVTVRFTNNVGQTSEATAEIAIVEPPVPTPKPKPTTGTIEGRVIQGDDRGQPGLDVDLLDEAAKVVETVKTNDKGEFKFKDVKPGKYTVASLKKADYFAKGEEKVTVVAGETAKPKPVSLKR